jgi:hypothetical protein
MQFIKNNDGSVSIVWNVPGAVLLSNGAMINQGLSQLQPLTINSPTPARSNTSYPESDQYCGYQAYAVLHVQFGTDSNNSVGDYPQALTTTPTTGSGYNGITYTARIDTAATSQIVTVPASAFNNPAAQAGLYAIGFIGIAWNSQLMNTSGTYWLAIEFGSNAQSFQPIPPTNPTGLSHTIGTNNSVNFTWHHSQPGTGAIAGYKLRWGTSNGGPYSNEVNCPISAYPITQTNTYSYSFPPATFSYDGSTLYFVVQAYDDGSSPVASTAPDPSSVIYTPTSLPSPTQKQPPQPTDPGGPGHGGGGKGGGGPQKIAL